MKWNPRPAGHQQQAGLAVESAVKKGQSEKEEQRMVHGEQRVVHGAW